MSSEFFDPDLKINMSLDQIIKLTRTELLGQLRGRFLRGAKKKKSQKRKGNPYISSVNLLSSLEEGYACLKKKSLLLSPENKRRIAMAFSNRIINSALIEKTKEIIPAGYKLIKTTTGIERVLVPVEKYIINANKKKPTSHTQFHQLTMMENPQIIPQLQQPPFLTVTPTFNVSENHSANNQFTKMEVDQSDDEVTIINHINRNQNKAVVIDVEPFSQARNIEIKAHQTVPQKAIIKTLNDRFTLLSSGIFL